MKLSMTATQLAEELGIGRATIFRIKREFPDSAPESFDDVKAWRILANAHLRNATSASLDIRASLSAEERYESRMRSAGYVPKKTRRGIVWALPDC